MLRLDDGSEVAYKLEMHDTAGDEHLGQKRKLTYKGADVFMICVSKDSRTSFDNIAKWKAEINEVETEKPIILVLTKNDLDGSIAVVSINDLKKERESGGFAGVYKTSAKDGDVLNAFKRTLKIGYRAKYG